MIDDGRHGHCLIKKIVMLLCDVAACDAVHYTMKHECKPRSSVHVITTAVVGQIYILSACYFIPLVAGLVIKPVSGATYRFPFPPICLAARLASGPAFCNVPRYLALM